MKDLLDKISSYNLFNYLLPGILFVVIAQKFTRYSFVQDNLVMGVFVYYFVCLIISRVGSLIIEPFLKKISFVVFADYSDFIIATNADPKIEILSEVNNMYRTIIAMLAAVALLKGYESVSANFTVL